MTVSSVCCLICIVKLPWLESWEKQFKLKCGHCLSWYNFEQRTKKSTQHLALTSDTPSYMRGRIAGRQSVTCFAFKGQTENKAYHSLYHLITASKTFVQLNLKFMLVQYQNHNEHVIPWDRDMSILLWLGWALLQLPTLKLHFVFLLLILDTYNKLMHLSKAAL